jgi:hypothetical protein
MDPQHWMWLLGSALTQNAGSGSVWYCNQCRSETLVQTLLNSELWYPRLAFTIEPFPLYLYNVVRYR